jgi:hypothetical protein
MSINHKKVAAVVLALFFLSLALKTTAVTVGPAKIEIKANPGDVVSGTINVFNEGAQEATFWADFEKFTEVEGEKRFLRGEEAELAGWFEMEKSVTLKATEGKDIPFIINIPKSAPPGGHFAVIWWGTAPPKKEGGEQVAIVTRAGILVFLQVSGQVSEKGSVLSFSLVKGKFFTAKLPEDFKVEFKNEGNTYLKPLGQIAVKNIFGSEVVSFSVNEKQRNLLPDTSRSLEVAPQFQKKPFAFGFYRAVLDLKWGDPQKPNVFEKSLWFFVFPWKVVLITLIILAVLFLFFTKGIKKYNQWIINKASTNTKIDEKPEVLGKKTGISKPKTKKAKISEPKKG